MAAVVGQGRIDHVLADPGTAELLDPALRCDVDFARLADREGFFELGHDSLGPAHRDVQDMDSRLTRGARQVQARRLQRLDGDRVGAQIDGQTLLGPATEADVDRGLQRPRSGEFHDDRDLGPRRQGGRDVLAQPGSDADRGPRGDRIAGDVEGVEIPQRIDAVVGLP